MNAPFWLTLFLLIIYAAFWLWWGGSGRPMKMEQRNELLGRLIKNSLHHEDADAIESVKALLDTDDGKAFVMVNLVRHRAKALYPPGSPYGDDAAQADRRYGRSIIWPLIRFGNVPIFIAKRTGHFLTPAGAHDWHYVAMVRYRSRRDFLRFAIAASEGDKFVHKWAAIETTHIFPVHPMISLLRVRSMMALLLALIAVCVHLVW
jgi:hypothetical protein